MQTWLADPAGIALHHYVHHGEPKAEGDGSIAEGIGTSRVTANMAQARLDDALMVDDHQAVPMVLRLRDEEGLFMGLSTGINVCAAREVARRLGPGHTVVTILCDLGRTYFSRLYNRERLASKGLDQYMP